MEFSDIISSRRSVRKFLEKPIEIDKLHDIIEQACLAPSWKNMQCWNFILVRDKNRIQAIANSAATGNGWIKDATAIIVGIADENKSGVRDGLNYYLVDFGIAFAYLEAAAIDKGLGVCFVGVFNESKVKDALSIPDGHRVVGIFPIGYPAEAMGIGEKMRRFFVKSGKRKPLADSLYYEFWQGK